LKNEVHEVQKLLSYKALQKKIDFRIEVADDVPEKMLGDPLRLKQVLINLTNNAIKFTQQGSIKIKVSLAKSFGDRFRIRFDVIDTGIGIALENQKKLFHSFAQADVSTTRKFGGTGLGLAISKHLVDLMNGKIGVISQEGEGSTFWFTATFEDALMISGKDDLDQIESVPNIAGKSQKLRILLVEDNVINQKVAMLTIGKLGHEVELAYNGVVAVDMFAKKKFDFILMDIQMPGMDGLEATKAIREIERERKDEKTIPIIALTANLNRDDVKHFLASGMDAHLGKPFKPNDLNDVIQKHLVR
jgi:CheY-like chemotaxis protein